MRIRVAKGCLGWGDRLIAGSEAMVRDSFCSLESRERKFGLLGSLLLKDGAIVSLRDSDLIGMAGVAGVTGFEG